MRKFKFTKVLAFMLVAVMLLLAAGCGYAQQKQESSSTSAATTATAAATTAATEKTAASKAEISIRFGHNLAIDSVINKAALMFAEEVSKNTNGKVEVKVYPAAQLGNERDMIEGVQSGTLEMMLATSAYLTNIQPEFGTLDLPFIFSGYDHVKKSFEGEPAKILTEKLLAGQKLRALSFWNSGFRVMLTKSAPLTSMADFKARKIRAPEAPVYINMFKALGANPTPIPFGEVYTSIQTGVVDGVEVSAELMYNMKFFEVGKYLAKTNHIYTTLVPLISEDVYSKFSDDVKSAIDAAMKTTVAYEWDAFIESDTKALKAMEDAGVKVNEIDRAELEKACLSMQGDYVKGAKSEALYEAIKALK